MKSFCKVLLISGALLSMSLTACNNNNGGSQEPEKEAGPAVFVLSGQSNMEGNSSFTESSLNEVFQGLNITDGDCCFTGIEEVQTSYYGQGYDHLFPNEIVGSNPTNKIDGLFLDTKAGMGHSSNSIGPELGMAYRLKGELEPDQKVYLIKCAFNGSGFDQGTPSANLVNWDTTQDPNLYKDHLKIFTQNCLNLIEEEVGVKPVVRGFIWNQGESDADNKKIPLYNGRMDALFGLFKNDFKDYAVDEDADNIAFIDTIIYEKNKSTTQALNDVKLENIQAHADLPYYYVDVTEREGGLALSCGFDNLHYDLASEFKLGMAYADVIIDNNLLD